MHDLSICACLTYAPEHLPAFGSLCKAHLSAFIKSLRQVVFRRGGPRLSFDACGEYSPLPARRPHYHLALFGYWPPSFVPAGKSQSGNDEYEADELTRAWGKGRVTFQPWSYGAAQYCAGHQSWKLTGEAGRLARQIVGPDGLAIGEREPEFHLPSTRPGIGRRFFEAYGRQALELGFTVVDGRQVPTPAYYLRRADIDLPELAERARAERTAKALESAARLAESGPSLDSVEEVAEVRIARGSRSKGGG